MKRQRDIHTGQRGFTLLEVLLTVVIMAFGLLSITRLQTVGLRLSNSAYLLTQASFLGKNMAERMRANMSGVKARAYDNIAGHEQAPGCATACNATQIAWRDAAHWNQRITNSLPAGQGMVSRDGDAFLIEVTWNEIDARGDPAIRQYAMSFVPW